MAEVILTGDQKRAIAKATEWYKLGNRQVFTIAGYAGTGKTEIVKQMVESIGITGVHFCAYTGKASLVLNQRGCPATTIHRLMYDFESSGVRVEGNRRLKDMKFRLKDTLEHGIQLVVVDEISMVPEKMMKDLLSFGLPVIAIGDPGQLPPVKHKNNTYLDDPDVFLDTVHRQAECSSIIRVSMLVRQGKKLQVGSYGDDVVVIRKKDVTDKMLLGASQVICGTHRTRRKLNNQVRELLGFDSEYPLVNDKIISGKNIWDLTLEGYPMINGLMGYVTKIHGINHDKRLMELDFRPDFMEEGMYFNRLIVDAHDFLGLEDEKNLNDNRNICWFDFGYALTCHKSQGSGFRNVLLYDEKRFCRDNEKRWLYTGITRAENRLIIAV